jgi:hypothetical protein
LGYQKINEKRNSHKSLNGNEPLFLRNFTTEKSVSTQGTMSVQGSNTKRIEIIELESRVINQEQSTLYYQNRYSAKKTKNIVLSKPAKN